MPKIELNTVSKIAQQCLNRVVESEIGHCVSKIAQQCLNRVVESEIGHCV